VTIGIATLSKSVTAKLTIRSFGETLKPFSSLSTRLAHVWGSFYKKALHKFTVIRPTVIT